MALTIPLKLKYRTTKPSSGGATKARTGSGKRKKPRLKQGYGSHRKAYGPF